MSILCYMDNLPSTIRRRPHFCQNTLPLAPMKKTDIAHTLSRFCLLLACAVLFACAKQPLPTLIVDKEVPGGPHYMPQVFFTPMTRSGAVQIPEAEALAILKTLPTQLQKTSWDHIDFALEQSYRFASKRPQKAVAIHVPGLQVDYGDITRTLSSLKKDIPRLKKQPQILATEYTWYRIGPDFGITGYYEPTLRASRTPSPKYYYPLYRKPSDLKRGKRYYTRHQIDRQGALAGKNLEIAWVDSEIDAFFLHIQGSGRLLFEDGSTTHVLYGAKNNRGYTAIGRKMAEQCLIDDDNVCMPEIRRYLDANPDKAPEIFDLNKSYVFFYESQQGPVGATGRPLTPWVTVATDKRVLPHGTPMMFVTGLPDTQGTHYRPFTGLMLSQDAGGAIKRNRIDVFFGPGEEAEYLAGHLDTKGAVYVLLKR